MVVNQNSGVPWRVVAVNRLEDHVHHTVNVVHYRMYVRMKIKHIVKDCYMEMMNLMMKIQSEYMCCTRNGLAVITTCLYYLYLW